MAVEKHLGRYPQFAAFPSEVVRPLEFGLGCSIHPLSIGSNPVNSVRKSRMSNHYSPEDTALRPVAYSRRLRTTASLRRKIAEPDRNADKEPELGFGRSRGLA